jgi:hypothetical protein
MTELLAKSPYGDRRITLLQHTLDVMNGGEWLFGTDTPTRLGRAWLRFFRVPVERWPAFRSNLLTSAGFHDWGKANDGMQNVAIREQVVEQRKATHAAGMVQAVLNADTAQVPAIVSEMAEYRKWTDPLLREESTSRRQTPAENSMPAWPSCPWMLPRWIAFTTVCWTPNRMKSRLSETRWHHTRTNCWTNCGPWRKTARNPKHCERPRRSQNTTRRTPNGRRCPSSSSW